MRRTRRTGAGDGVRSSPQPAREVGRQPADAVPWSLRVAAAWAWRVLLVGAVVAGLLYLVWTFRLIAIAVFVALLLAALMQPPVSWLRRLGAPRVLAVGTVFGGGVALVGGLFYLLSGLLAAGFSDLGAAVASSIDQLGVWLRNLPVDLGVAQLNDLTARLKQWVVNNARRIAQGALTTAAVTARILAGLLLTLVVTLFFVYDGARIWSWVVGLFPRGTHTRLYEAGRGAWDALAGYVQGTIIVALFDAVLIGLILILVGLPASLAVALGVLTFFGAFVPIVGALVTGILAVLVVAVLQGLTAALITLGGVVAVQQLEGNVLQPLVVGRSVRLHPLAVLLAVTAGGIVAGIAGAVVAVPLAAVINTTTRYFVRASTPEDE